MKGQKEQSKLIAGVYCRLSDDDDQDGTSVSIETQRKINGEYCRTNGIIVYDYYCDDGWSGTNFKRPAFERMMNDVKEKKINAVIVKDLSRFGRNYLQVGSYLSEVFPTLGIRFIAIHDNVDSATTNLDYDLTVPIRNVFNEYYPAECSRKTKIAFIAKAKNGEFIGSQAPYGYRKSPLDKHILELDEEIAPIVRWIFETIAYKGIGFNKVARMLREKKVPTPGAHQAKVANRPYLKDPYDWNLVTVFTMVRNPTYLGHMISGRRRKPSFKSKRMVKMPEEDWIVVENKFPAIVDQQLWEDTQKAISSRKYDTKSGVDNIFAGLIKCEKCGYALGISTGKDKIPYYTCNQYRKKGPQCCSSHYILFRDVYQSVLKDLQSTMASIQDNKQEFVETVLKRSENIRGDRRNSAEKEITLLETRIEQLNVRFEQLYEDRLGGILSDQKFKELSAKCEIEEEQLKERLERLHSEVSERGATQDGVEGFVQRIEQFESVETLNRELLNRLVDSIVIGDRFKENGKAKQTITINYRFAKNVPITA